MPGIADKARSRLPAPVIAAVMAIIVTRLFNLLMCLWHPEGPPRDGVFQELTTPPGYLLLFGVLLAELISAGLLLVGWRGGRLIFTGCLCLTLAMAGIFGGQVPGLTDGLDVADVSQLSVHLLLQKIPDMVILLMLYLPASSRYYFRGKQR
ncbi:YbjO family protein [Tatumella sp. UBA2305]|uniref:YbjO family protein n=1 Tax=Tatumella sp. UBA2305 TaxID=1947647 RepID=UPI0025D3CD17|nr:YbjO family protein [Tatumella sp. UBA2305]